jgi:hypothetical protein
VNGTAYSGTGYSNVNVSSTLAATNAQACTIDATALSRLYCKVGTIPIVVNRGITAGVSTAFNGTGVRTTSVQTQTNMGGWTGGGVNTNVWSGNHQGPFYSQNSTTDYTAVAPVGSWLDILDSAASQPLQVASILPSTTNPNQIVYYSNNTLKNFTAFFGNVWRPSGGSTNAFNTNAAMALNDGGMCNILPGRALVGTSTFVGSFASQTSPPGLMTGTIGTTTLTTPVPVTGTTTFSRSVYHCGDSFRFNNQMYAVTGVSNSASQQVLTVTPPLKETVSNAAILNWKRSFDWGWLNAGGASEFTGVTISPVNATTIQTNLANESQWVEPGDWITCSSSSINGAAVAQVSSVTTTNIVTSTAHGCTGIGSPVFIMPRLYTSTTTSPLGITAYGPYLVANLQTTGSTTLPNALLSNQTVNAGQFINFANSGTATATVAANIHTANVNFTPTVFMPSAATASGTVQTFGAFGPYGPGDGTTTFNVPNLVGRVSIGGLSGALATVGNAGGATSISASNPYIVGS